MNKDQKEFLSVPGLLPGRLTCQQVAWMIGCAEHDVPTLAAAGILKPLGKPAANAPKYYALSQVEELRQSPKLLHKATEVIQQHWRRKRTAKRIRPAQGNDQYRNFHSTFESQEVVAEGKETAA